MRVVVADPPAYTPPYDYALSAALVRQGFDVRLLTSRFRFGAVPPAAGFAVDDSLYGFSTRLRGRHGSGSRRRPWDIHGRLREPRTARPRPPPSAVGVGAGASLTLAPAHARAARLHRPRPVAALESAPHEHLEAPISALRPGRHAQRATGAAALEASASSDVEAPVIAHPAFRSEPVRDDDGHTVLALGVIRSYKGLPDAIEAVSGTSEGARLLVAGDPRIPIDGLRQQAGERVEWRLGYLGEGEIADVLGATTVAVFPYRAELDQSGALLQVIGAGIPAVVYDVGGLGEIRRCVRRGPRGRAAVSVDGLERALRELLDDEDALAAARAGAWQLHARASPGTAPAPPIARSTRSSCEIPPAAAASTSSSTGSSTSSPPTTPSCWPRRPTPSPRGTPPAAESAEEAYGDYQLVVDAIADRLLDIRESYAHSLDEDAADEYRDAFTRAASRRYRRYATLLAGSRRAVGGRQAVRQGLEPSRRDRVAGGSARA